MLTSTLLPLLESLRRLAMTAGCGRSSCCSSTRTSVTMVRVLLRAVDVARTHSCLSLLASYAGWPSVSESEEKFGDEPPLSRMTVCHVTLLASGEAIRLASAVAFGHFAPVELWV